MQRAQGAHFLRPLHWPFVSLPAGVDYHRFQPQQQSAPCSCRVLPRPTERGRRRLWRQRRASTAPAGRRCGSTHRLRSRPRLSPSPVGVQARAVPAWRLRVLRQELHAALSTGRSRHPGARSGRGHRRRVEADGSTSHPRFARVTFANAGPGQCFFRKLGSWGRGEGRPRSRPAPGVVTLPDLAARLGEPREEQSLGRELVRPERESRSAAAYWMTGILRPGSWTMMRLMIHGP